MAASDYVPGFFKNRLHLAGRPQKGSSLHHRCSDLRHLDSSATAILLSARRLTEIGLKAKKWSACDLLFLQF